MGDRYAIDTQSPMLLRAQLPPWEEPLKLQVKGRNLTLSSDIEDYAVEKVGKLERLLSSETPVEVELSVEKV